MDPTLNAQYEKFFDGLTKGFIDVVKCKGGSHLH